MKSVSRQAFSIHLIEMDPLGTLARCPLSLPARNVCRKRLNDEQGIRPVLSARHADACLQAGYNPVKRQDTPLRFELYPAVRLLDLHKYGSLIGTLVGLMER